MRGQTTPQVLIGLVVLGVVGLVAYAVLRQQSMSVTEMLPVISFETDASQFSAMLARSGESAQTPFVPAQDIGGNSNADGHEIDFYYLPTAGSIAGRGVFYALCGRTSSGDCTSSQAVGTLGEYSYAWSALPQHGGSGATFVSGSADTRLMPFSVTVASTAAQFSSPAVNPYTSAMFASTQFPSPQTYQWGYPGLTSTTNTVFLVHYGSGIDARILALRAAHTPVSVQYINGTQTPTPNPLGVSSAALDFRAPVAAAQSLTVSESNYGTRSTTPAQVYALGSGCNSFTVVAPGTPVTPSSNGTGDATLTVTPIVQLSGSNASCSISVTDNTPQSQTVGVEIGQVYAPSASGTTIAFSAGAKAPVTVQEQNYDVPSPGRGGMTLVGYLSNGSEALSSADTSGDPNGVCDTAIGTSGRSSASLGASPSYIETEAWNIGFAKPGVCWPVFADTYGQRVVPNGVNGIQATASIKSWPQQLILGVGEGTVGTTSGASPIAYTRSLDATIGAVLNRLLFGGVARAAAASQPCYALAETTAYTTGANAASYVDTSLPESISSELGVYVDSNGCEVNSDDVPIPAANAAMISYNSSDSSSTYGYVWSGCGAVGNPSWETNNVAVQAILETYGKTAGTCSVTFSGSGLGAATGPDAGVVAITTQNSGCTITVAGSCWVTMTWDDIDNCGSQNGNGGGQGGSNQCATTAGVTVTDSQGNVDRISLSSIPAADITPIADAPSEVSGWQTVGASGVGSPAYAIGVQAGASVTATTPLSYCLQWTQWAQSEMTQTYGGGPLYQYVYSISLTPIASASQAIYADSSGNIVGYGFPANYGFYAGGFEGTNGMLYSSPFANCSDSPNS